MHSLHVKCEVEADPPDGVRFSWTYNNTRNVSPVLNSRISSHGLVSTMTYLPQSDSELVTLACWAINNVGRQTLHNDTVLEVVCLAGSDGGLMQSFLLEVVGGVAPPAYNLDFTRGPPTEIDNEISTMNDQVMAFVCTFRFRMNILALRTIRKTIQDEQEIGSRKLVATIFGRFNWRVRVSIMDCWRTKAVGGEQVNL
uniref:Ig-like domain-containing protein n=1 Tax=Anopheles maculatus TaxID=74869 RepID=A0A182SDG0_9DIPT